MTSKDVLAEKDLKRVDITDKQYQGLDKAIISNKDNKNVNESLIKTENKKYNETNLICNRLSLYSFSDNKKFDSF